MSTDIHDEVKTLSPSDSDERSIDDSASDAGSVDTEPSSVDKNDERSIDDPVLGADSVNTEPSSLDEDDDTRSSKRGMNFYRDSANDTKDGNKWICKWSGCRDQEKTFDRRCEWTKHMDKHDRPYKCDIKGCESLPGFTYSGGLLRHSQEVHKKAGGKRLFCHHQDCKRSQSIPFTRKENLDQHLRRVHREGKSTAGGGTEINLSSKRKSEDGDEYCGSGRAKKHKVDDDQAMELTEILEMFKAENDNTKALADMVQEYLPNRKKQEDAIMTVLNSNTNGIGHVSSIKTIVYFEATSSGAQ